MKGIELVERFFFEIIEPMINARYPELRYAAAFLGAGSEVLGYDDEISQDHDWGLRLNLFVADTQISEQLDQYFRDELPGEFLGFSTHWGEADDKGVRLMTEDPGSGINHRIEISTVQQYLDQKLNLKIDRIDELSQLSIAQWLSLPEQSLLEFVSGRVFKDGSGKLNQAREYLGYYPRTVWIFAMLGEWNHIAEEQVFIARSGDTGSDTGSRLIATSMVNRIIRLAIHLESRYIPYAKWKVKAFEETTLHGELSPIISKILDSRKWREREELLNQALGMVIERHIELGLVKRYDYGPVLFHTREYYITNWGPLMDKLTEQLPEELRDMTHKIGTVNQIISYTNIVSNKDIQNAVHTFYRSLLASEQ